MKRIYSAASLAEAYLILHALAHAGIAGRILNEHAQGGLGDIPFTHAWPEVWIEQDRDIEQARIILARYESAQVSGALRCCRSCKEENPVNFEFCWRCGAIFDER